LAGRLPRAAQPVGGRNHRAGVHLRPGDGVVRHALLQPDLPRRHHQRPLPLHQAPGLPVEEPELVDHLGALGVGAAGAVVRRAAQLLPDRPAQPGVLPARADRGEPPQPARSGLRRLCAVDGGARHHALGRPPVPDLPLQAARGRRGAAGAGAGSAPGEAGQAGQGGAALNAAAMRPALVLFDVDGTLVDSEELGTRVLLEMAAELGVRRPLKETNRLFRGWRLDDCGAQIRVWLGKPLPEDFVAQVRLRTAATFRRELRPVPGAPELVRALHDRAIPICVASSGPREKIELSLSLTGLLPYFEDRIFSGYELQTWKPDPGLFLHAARVLGAEPAACLVVEDSLVGVQAALAAGMRVLAFQPEQADPQSPAPVRSIRRLDEVLGVLGV